MTTLSKRLKEERKLRKLTQAQLEELSSVSSKSISIYETGKAEPPAFLLFCLADAFGVSMDYLMGRTDCKEVNECVQM